jgi:hypothetical protein
MPPRARQVKRYLGIDCCVLMGANIATASGGGGARRGGAGKSVAQPGPMLQR